MRKVTIKRNTDGDTRVAKAVPSFYRFRKSNEQHREDVRGMMREIANDINVAGAHHDYTKTDDDTGSLFYRELCNTLEGQMNFEDGRWYKMHCETERHHLNEHCPDDVNLIDVIEMICDCVCAGLARSGSVRPVEIDADILKRAVDNTVDMLVEAVEVGDSDGHT